MLWERVGRMSAALAADVARFPAPDPQWIEDRMWTWVHYVATKVGRGELLEAVDSLAFIRGLALGPLALASRGARPIGVRKLERRRPTWPGISRAPSRPASVARASRRSSRRSCSIAISGARWRSTISTVTTPPRPPPSPTCARSRRVESRPDGVRPARRILRRAIRRRRPLRDARRAPRLTFPRARRRLRSADDHEVHCFVPRRGGGRCRRRRSVRAET